MTLRKELRPGDVVMLPDGAVAAVEKIDGTDAYVVEWTRKHGGRGPWIFPVSDLLLVPAGQQDEIFRYGRIWARLV